MKTFKWIIIIIILFLIGSWFYGYETVISKIYPKYLCKDLVLNQILEEKDSRNKGIDISICYKSAEEKTIIVMEIHSLSKDKSRVDVFRYILQTAEQFKNRSFKKIEFAYNGVSKFYILGNYFKKLGEEYQWQNAVYTQRTFPENIKNMDGTDAFPTWTGGLIGILQKQTEDNIKFHDEWYWNEMSEE